MFDFLKKLRYAVRSPKWAQVRKEHLKNNPYCIACGRNKKLEVHHKVPVHISPELELTPSNLVTLCADPCHLLFGHLLSFKSWNSQVIIDSEVYYNKVKNRP
jgi:5-methylcytosine-specific restriction endonuclease McrA